MIIFQVGWLSLSLAYTIFAVHDWSLISIYRNYIHLGRHVLWFPETFTNNSSNVTAALKSKSEVAADIFFCLFGICSNTILRIQFTMILTAFGLSAFIIWITTVNFMALVNKYNDNNKNSKMEMMTPNLAVNQFREKYEELRDLVHAVNTMWSDLICWFILDFSLWMATNLDRIQQSSENYIFLINNCFILATTFVACVLSADCSRRVSAF